jgi:hypothetical protein
LVREFRLDAEGAMVVEAMNRTKITDAERVTWLIKHAVNIYCENYGWVRVTRKGVDDAIRLTKRAAGKGRGK